MQKKYLINLLLVFVFNSILFISCSYQLTGKKSYPFKKAEVSAKYKGPYATVPAYFKPAFKEELKYRISNLSFTHINPDLSLKIDILNINLEPLGITYLTNHPTANTYLLKMRVQSFIKTKDFEQSNILERSRTFASGLNTSQSNLASISQDYNFRATAKGLAKDISRELINLFLAHYNSTHSKKAIPKIKEN